MSETKAEGTVGGGAILSHNAVPPPGPPPEEREVTIEAKPTGPPAERTRLIESYWIEEPFVRIDIVDIKEKGWATGYFVEEIKLDERELKAYRKLTELLSRELSPPREESEDATAHLLSEVHRLIDKYRSFLATDKEESERRIEYFIRRDLVGYGPIDAMVRDANIEDISCDGLGKPIYVWHAKYESLFSNVIITDKNDLDNFIIKLAHLAGRHVSTAFPIVDAMLPGRHRLVASYSEEVTTAGSTFCIRKFRERPFSITELIEMGTLDVSMASYFWLLLDLRLTLMIIGGTGAGKTSLLNALANLFKPGLKIVTVEETAELNIPHENWVQFVSRESYGLGATKTGEVSLFELVKTTLRYRPDYIIVGEVRGSEAFVLFQAMATGHGGISTIHADSLDYATKRLTSPPMNVGKTYIPVLNAACLIERVSIPSQPYGVPFGRRVASIWEIQRDGSNKVLSKWDPVSDSFELDPTQSTHIKEGVARMGHGPEYAREELARRQLLLGKMIEKGITDYREVAKVISQYHVRSREGQSL